MVVTLTIAATSTETGIAKEVLRKWEVRYGFPLPVRDSAGNRGFSPEQVQRLKMIKRLINDGMRPGRVPLDGAALATLIARGPLPVAEDPECDCACEIIALLRARDPAGLREKLQSELAKRGQVAFVRDLMPLMNERVGEAWARGDIAVCDEHLYSEMVQGLVRHALGNVTNPGGMPRVLLTSPTGEAHILGLLMVESILSAEGAFCIPLGAQSPLPDISAAASFGVHIVGLSFSASFPKNRIAPVLKELHATAARSAALGPAVLVS